jgi:hypothetical protein
LSVKTPKIQVDEILDWLSADGETEPSEKAWPTESLPKQPDSSAALPSEDTLEDLHDPQRIPIRVGHRETVSLPEHGIHQLLARFSTDAERSTLHGSIRQVVANQLTLELGQSVVELPTLEDQDSLLVSLTIALDDLSLEGPLQVVATSGTPFLILGRDLLAGQVVVDPSTAWVKSKR